MWDAKLYQETSETQCLCTVIRMMVLLHTVPANIHLATKTQQKSLQIYPLSEQPTLRTTTLVLCTRGQTSWKECIYCMRFLSQSLGLYLHYLI